MPTRKILSLLAILLLPACMMTQKSAPNQDVQVETEAPIIVPLGSDEVLSRLGKLPSQQLGANECGLFLWLRREDVPLVFFQRSDGRAYMALDGVVRMLERTAADQSVVLQYYRNQVFSAPGLSVSLSIVPEASPSLQQGLKVPNGNISIEGDDGWAAALPVAGVIGCQ